MNTYLRGGLANLLHESRFRARSLLRQRDEVRRVRMRMELAEQHLKTCFDEVWRDKCLLDIGCGQLLRNARHFALHNEVIAIDRAVPLRAPYHQSVVWMLRESGCHRTAKTLVRQCLGVDRRYRRAFSREMSVTTVPVPHIRCMDASSLAFPDRSFDGAFSFSTFQHLAKPREALRELRRVLKPGACAYIDLHLYTSLTGSDHPLLKACPKAVPPWAHLRRSQRLYGRDGLYVNRIRLRDWKEYIAEVFTDCRFLQIEAESASARALLTPAIRAELAEYETAELLTTTFIAVVRR